jgi:hypothetical protein
MVPMSKLDLLTTAVDGADEELRRKHGMPTWAAQSIDALQIVLGISIFGLSGMEWVGIALKVLAVALVLGAVGTTLGRWR